MFRKGNKQDLPSITLLWSEVFGDTQAVAQTCITNFIGLDNMFVAEKNASIVSILFTAPCNIGSDTGVYLYALATNPAFRGAGTMSGLMEYAQQNAKQNGAKFACLVPANDELYTYYNKRGYTETIYLRTLQKDIQPNILAVADFDTITAPHLKELRKKHIEGVFVDFSPQQYKEIVADLYAAGAETAETKDGYAIYFYNKQDLLIAELGATSTTAANYLLQAIHQRLGHKKALITLQQGGNVFAGEGSLKKTALLKPLDESWKAEDLYMRFVLDEVWKQQ